MRVYSVFVLVLCVGSGLATGLIPHPRSPTDSVLTTALRDIDE
jgi:hypothetical protein